MNIKISSKDIIWNYLGVILSLSANFIMLPFIIYFISGEMLGLWYIFQSLGGIVVLFDFGFNTSFSRNIAYCWSGATELIKKDVIVQERGEVDFYLMKKVLLVCRTIYAYVSIGVLILLFSLGTVYIAHISNEIEGNMHLIAWIVYALATFLNLLFGYYSSFLRGVGDIVDANKAIVYAKFVQIILTVFLLYVGLGILGICIAYFVYGLFFRWLGKKYFYEYKEIGLHIGEVEKKPSKDELKDIFQIVWFNAWRDGIVSVSNYLCNQASTIICSLYLSLTETGQYSLGVQLATVLSNISASVYSTYQPAIQSAYIKNEKKRIREMMSIIVTSFIFIYLIGLLGIVYMGIPILEIIKKGTSISIGYFILIALYQFILKFRNCYTSYFSCTNRLPYVRSFIIFAVLSVVMSYLAIGPFKLGLIGLLIAQILSQAVFNLWYWALLVHKELDCGLADFIRNGTTQIVNLIKKRLNKRGKA